MKTTSRSLLPELAPSVGWPVTVCVLVYGDHPDLAGRFFERLVRHTPMELVRTRIGMNAVGAATRRIVDSFVEDHPGTWVVDSGENLFKNRMMRRLFHERPLETRWAIWFDDDSFVRRDDWLQSLAMRIEGSPGSSMLGRPAMVAPDRRVLRFVESAAWFRGKPFLRIGEDGGGSEWFTFVEGGFWAVRSDAVRMLDWPDPRLIHYLDDFIMGEALRQNDLTMVPHWSGVEISASPRRGPLDGRSGVD